MRAHGWVGLGIVGAAELLLVWGESTVAGWFTPIVWTGYVLFVDALVARLTLRSYLTTDRVEGVLVALASVGCWWLFELYNAPRFWRGGVDAVGLWWQYHDLELPLAFVSVWLVPLVWVGWALLLEPLNYRRGWPSWLADIGRGDASRLLALLASGAVCGALWEFWNYWAAARWTYTVPYLGGIRIFEMPMLGYLGFLPFALEVYAMYHWLRGRLGQHAAEPVL